MQKNRGLCLFLVFVCFAFKQEPNNKCHTLIPGVGFDNIRIGKTTRADLINIYGKGYKTYTNYARNPDDSARYVYSIRLSYQSLGLAFYFYPNEETIFDIEVKSPFSAKTQEGITLNESRFDDVAKIYGRTDWTFAGKDLMMSYDTLGIEFRRIYNDTLPISDEKLEAYLNTKVTEIDIYQIRQYSSE